MSKKRRLKQKLDKKKKITVLVSVLLAVLIVVGAILWITRPKQNGIFNWYGAKMNADNILNITIDVGNGEQKYVVPFSEYRAIYTYYAKRVLNFLAYEKPGEGNKIEVYSKYTTVAQKSAAVKEVTEKDLVEYYDRIALAEYLGVGLTDADRQKFQSDFDKQVADYADTLPDDVKYKGGKEAYALKQYLESLDKMGMSKEYLEFSYLSDLLYKRIRGAISVDIEDVTNESYFAFKEIYISYSVGDTKQENQAIQSITEAMEKLKSGADIDELISEYNTNNKNTTYFDYYYNIGGSSKDTLGTDYAESVKALNHGEFSSILSGQESEQVGFYSIIQRVRIDKDFILSGDAIADDMFKHPYFGSSNNSYAYSEYLSYMEAYEANTSKVPVSDRVYRRIAVNTLF